jgi:hypothetical protein
MRYAIAKANRKACASAYHCHIESATNRSKQMNTTELSLRELNAAHTIAANYYEPRKNWNPELQRKSMLTEARRLHDQCAQVARGEIGGIPRVWRFVALMLTNQAMSLRATS